MPDGISDKPDFRFTYEEKRIGLEVTRCYPPDALIHKNNKDQNKYEIGDKGVDAIIKRYKKNKTERGEWISLFIGFFSVEIIIPYSLRPVQSLCRGSTFQ